MTVKVDTSFLHTGILLEKVSAIVSERSRKLIEVMQGTALQLFNKVGGGVQYVTLKTVKQLKEAGIFKSRPDKKRREDW